MAGKITLGGAGGGIAYDHEDLLRICEQGLALSPETEVLVEQSIEGWKEIEMEVMRDVAGNGMADYAFVFSTGATLGGDVIFADGFQD